MQETCFYKATLPITTLGFNPFTVTRSTKQLHVEMVMRAHKLDRRGFVVSTKSFRRLIEREAQGDTPRTLGRSIIELARKIAGGRLVNINVLIRSVRHQAMTEWPGDIHFPWLTYHDARKGEENGALNKFEVGVKLVDQAVCDSYSKGVFVASIGYVLPAVDRSRAWEDDQLIRDSIRAEFAGKVLKASCEELTRGIIHAMHKLQGEKLVSMRASIDIRTGSAATVWAKGMPVPAFPRRATKLNGKRRSGENAAVHAAARSSPRGSSPRNKIPTAYSRRDFLFLYSSSLLFSFNKSAKRCCTF